MCAIRLAADRMRLAPDSIDGGFSRTASRPLFCFAYAVRVPRRITPKSGDSGSSCFTTAHDKRGTLPRQVKLTPARARPLLPTAVWHHTLGNTTTAIFYFITQRGWRHIRQVHAPAVWALYVFSFKCLHSSRSCCMGSRRSSSSRLSIMPRYSSSYKFRSWTTKHRATRQRRHSSNKYLKCSSILQLAVRSRLH